ncbi:MAG TPA: hypothetical protein VK694_07040 [Verrucomicrobiae bacterium]|nr:hypothetical protein [Verrucomicrobiae bacterium]
MNPQSPYPQQPGLPPSGGQLPYPGQQPGMAASRRRRHFNWLIIPVVVLFLLSCGTGAFAIWASSERLDYKNNSDQKAAAAVTIAKKEVETTKEKEFAEREKNPFKDYKGPTVYGSVEMLYPKTWAAYIDEAGRSGGLIVGHFHPDFVPGLSSGTAFALKLEVLQQPYNGVLNGYDSAAKKGTVQVQPFSLAKVPSVLGTRVNGEIEKGVNGSAVLLPLRDKTIRVSTLSQTFINDFNNIILPNLSFVP